MNAMQKSYLKFFKPDGLLVLGGWSEAAQKHFDIFWSERFCLDIPSDLVEAVFPFLATLNAQVEKLGPESTTSMRSVPQVLQYLAVVLVQDACELASTNSAHPVYAYLMQQEPFRCGCCYFNTVFDSMMSLYVGISTTCDVVRELQRAYQQKKEAGTYEVLRPRSTREEVALMNQRLEEAYRNGRPQLGIQYCPTRIQTASAIPVSYQEELAENNRQFDHLLVLAAAAAQEHDGSGQSLSVVVLSTRNIT